MDDRIDSERNQTLASKLTKTADNTETLIDPNNSIFISFGIPTDERCNIIVPNNPHVFNADELYIYQGDNSEPVLLNNVTVLSGHGKRESDKWLFNNNQPVVETLESYNRYANREGAPTVEFVAVCNDDPTTNSEGTQFHEFGISSSIAHAAGEKIKMSGITENGKTQVYINANNILNLESLVIAKDINIE